MSAVVADVRTTCNHEGHTALTCPVRFAASLRRLGISEEEINDRVALSEALVDALSGRTAARCEVARKAEVEQQEADRLVAARLADPDLVARVAARRAARRSA